MMVESKMRRKRRDVVCYGSEGTVLKTVDRGKRTWGNVGKRIKEGEGREDFYCFFGEVGRDIQESDLESSQNSPQGCQQGKS